MQTLQSPQKNILHQPTSSRNRLNMSHKPAKLIKNEKDGALNAGGPGGTWSVNGVDMDSNCVHTSDILRQGLSESKAERMDMFSQPLDLLLNGASWLYL